MGTPNLAIAHIATNQNNKETTANSAFDLLDLALTAQFSKVMPDADYTLANPTESLQVIVIRFTGSTATTQRNAVVPNVAKLYCVRNETSQSIQVKTVAGTGIVVLPGDQAILYCDATNVVRLSPAVTKVAKYSAVAQVANIVNTPVYTPAASGLYRVTAYLVVTTVATTSSTLPSATVQFTDADTNIAVGAPCSVAVNATGNTLGIFAQGEAIIRAKAATAIGIATQSYASVGGTAMQYAIYFNVEPI